MHRNQSATLNTLEMSPSMSPTFPHNSCSHLITTAQPRLTHLFSELPGVERLSFVSVGEFFANGWRSTFVPNYIMPRYKCAHICTGGGSNRYKCETNTFVPGGLEEAPTHPMRGHLYRVVTPTGTMPLFVPG
jgi:hypothetical protein